MTPSRFCEQCGAALSPTARFCANCGFSLTGAAPASTPATDTGTATGATAATAAPGAARYLTWLVPMVAVIAVIAYAAGSSSRAPVDAGTPLGGMPGSAPDISSLSPDERVDRLFNRVMAASSAGKTDTVMFFAPMAISSFAALEPLSLHRRYDLGLVLMVSGQEQAAQAEADTILRASPKHLLGLVLAMRVANRVGDTAAAQRWAARLKDAVATERARGLPEYQDHATDIDVALAEADLRSKGAAPTPKKD